LQRDGVAGALASEEMEKPVFVASPGRPAPYMVLFDPLDGSSNTDVNMPLGSIFSIVEHQHQDQPPGDSDLLRKGVHQLAAGYFLFGPSTMLVFTTGKGVFGFTLDPNVGEYQLSHPGIKMPSRGKVYAVNEGNYEKWPAGTKRYVDSLKKPDKAAGRPYTGRYSGCPRGRCAPVAAWRGNLFVSRRNQQTGREIATAVRGQSHGDGRRAGRRQSEHRRDPHPRD
jgi:fructose-1,6-bisphosphatase I